MKDGDRFIAELNAKRHREAIYRLAKLKAEELAHRARIVKILKGKDA